MPMLMLRGEKNTSTHRQRKEIIQLLKEIGRGLGILSSWLRERLEPNLYHHIFQSRVTITEQ